MKLICFHLFNDYSGSPKVLKNLLCNLQAQGVEMELITSRGGILDEIPHSPNFKRRSYSYRFSNHAIIATIKYFAAQVYTFFVALGYAFKKDTVFYINTILPVGPAIAGRLTGKKVIYHYHENAMVKSAFYRALAWIMQKIASEIICVSEYQRSFLKREIGVSVVPNSIEESFINKLQPAPEKSFERKTVLMLGSLKRYKGTLEFVELARRLPQYKFELVLNERKENIVTFWQENSIVNNENLVVHARHDDVSIFYNRASVVLNLSNKDLFVETFGLTALEAMAAGLPIIVPTVGGIAEMVNDGENGYKIDVQDLDKIEEFLKNILSNRDLYLYLSNNGLLRSKTYSATKMAQEILFKIKGLGSDR